MDRPSSPTTARSPVIKAGYLYKKGGGERRRNWTKRWFELRGHTLAYFENRSCTKLKGEIPLANCSVEEFNHESRSFVFLLKGCNRTYFISGGSSQEVKSWIKVIEKTVLAMSPASESKETEPLAITQSSPNLTGLPLNRGRKCVSELDPKKLSVSPNEDYLPSDYKSMSHSELINLIEALGRDLQTKESKLATIRDETNTVVGELMSQVSLQSAENKRLLHQLDLINTKLLPNV